MRMNRNTSSAKMKLNAADLVQEDDFVNRRDDFHLNKPIAKSLSAVVLELFHVLKESLIGRNNALKDEEVVVHDSHIPLMNLFGPKRSRYKQHH